MIAKIVNLSILSAEQVRQISGSALRVISHIPRPAAPAFFSWLCHAFVPAFPVAVGLVSAASSLKIIDRSDGFNRCPGGRRGGSRRRMSRQRTPHRRRCCAPIAGAGAALPRARALDQLRRILGQVGVDARVHTDVAFSRGSHRAAFVRGIAQRQGGGCINCTNAIAVRARGRTGAALARIATGRFDRGGEAGSARERHGGWRIAIVLLYLAIADTAVAVSAARSAIAGARGCATEATLPLVLADEQELAGGQRPACAKGAEITFDFLDIRSMSANVPTLMLHRRGSKTGAMDSIEKNEITYPAFQSQFGGTSLKGCVLCTGSDEVIPAMLATSS
jgi:hypothetical protein